MKPKLPTIVFFGSGPVAAASLQLLMNDFEIEAVITKPVPAHHRGTAPVIELCKQNDLTVHTPASKHELTEFFADKKFVSPLGIVIDYGIIISQDVIDYFSHGIVNSHFSLLPKWRGADPISFAILSGQPQTGVSLMSINDRMDEGPLLAQEQLLIQADDTSASLTAKLIQLSHDMLVRHLPAYSDGSLVPYPQFGEPTYSRKLTKSDGLIDWSKPAAVLEREIRAYYEWPKSTATVGSQTFIVRQADVVNTSGKPGDFEISKKELLIFCGEDALKITRLQPLNKKEMPVEAFLAGYQL